MFRNHIKDLLVSGKLTHWKENEHPFTFFCNFSRKSKNSWPFIFLTLDVFWCALSCQSIFYQAFSHVPMHQVTSIKSLFQDEITTKLSTFQNEKRSSPQLACKLYQKKDINNERFQITWQNYLNNIIVTKQFTGTI